MTRRNQNALSRFFVFSALGLTCTLGLTSTAQAGQQTPVSSTARTHRTLGIQGFGTIGVGFPVASESLATVGVDKRPREFGGGVQGTNLWRGLFVQVAASRWTGDGSRVFMDSRGTQFDLGIPLSVKATLVDIGAGWRFQSNRLDGNTSRIVPYAGGGLGLVDYSETSRFADDGENLAERTTTYSVLGGVEVRLTSWLSVAADARYRYVKGILGNGGVSAALGDDSLSGPAASLHLLLGWSGTSKRELGPRRGRPVSQPARPAAEQSAPAAAAPASAPAKASAGRPHAIAVVDAPVRIAPDRSREPLTLLEPGTQVVVVEQESGWLRVEFRDPRWGLRVGYVEVAHVRVVAEPR